MILKTGDRVKFLNENGGGIVSKVISANLVHVKTEDGFEIPTLSSELVKVEPAGKSGRMFIDGFTIDLDEKTREIPPDEVEKPSYDNRSSPLRVLMGRGNDKKGVYLAFVPHDQKWLLTGLMDVYLVNYSDWDISCVMFLRRPNGAWEGIDRDMLAPNTKLLVNTIQREEIERWSYGIVQALFQKELSSKVLMPASCTFSFKPAKLYNENVFLTSSFLGEKAFILNLVETDTLQAVVTSEEGAKVDQEVKEQLAKPKKEEEVIERHKTSPREAVVDLHIGELVEDYSGMSNAEMLNYQLNYFVRCLESGIKGYVTKIIFIHGVGDGVLKSKMLEILQHYENIRVQDASMRKFGYGATEVLIWYS